MVLDLSPQPLLKRVELPEGYLAPGRDPLDQALAVIDLLGYSGDFEKPRYVAVNERLCAHSRSQKAGCSNCIDVCATAAITGAGDSIKLDPYLCQGCGTCTTVCPSGALSYQYPRVADVGLAIKAQLNAYRAAGGSDPCLLFHSAQAGRQQLQALKRAGRSLPINVIPVETWSADAVGLDLLLGAVALGASQVAVLGAGSHDLAPLRKQAALGQAILDGLGYRGEHLRIIDAENPRWLDELAAWPAATGVPPAEFRLLADKRTTLEFVIDHLAKQAPAPSRRHSAAARRAVRHGDCQRRLYAVHGVHQRLPGQRPEGGGRCAAPLFPRTQLRAVRPVRQYLPGTGDHADAAPAAERPPPRAPAQGVRGILLHGVRQADGRRADDHEHAQQAVRAQHVRDAGSESPPDACAAIAGSST